MSLTAAGLLTPLFASAAAAGVAAQAPVPISGDEAWANPGMLLIDGAMLAAIILAFATGWAVRGRRRIPPVVLPLPPDSEQPDPSPVHYPVGWGLQALRRKRPV